MTASRSDASKPRRLALATLVAAGAVALSPAGAHAVVPNAQGIVSSGGAAAGSPPVALANDTPRPATQETGRKAR